jgi:hypothetical protein
MAEQISGAVQLVNDNILPTPKVFILGGSPNFALPINGVQLAFNKGILVTANKDHIAAVTKYLQDTNHPDAYIDDYDPSNPLHNPAAYAQNTAIVGTFGVNSLGAVMGATVAPTAAIDVPTQSTSGVTLDQAAAASQASADALSAAQKAVAASGITPVVPAAS